MLELKALLDKLQKFYWSPEHPTTYKLINPDNGRPCGIGCVARRDYAAFNLAWATCRGKWKTMADQRSLYASFAAYEEHTSKLIAGYPLSEWIYLYTPTEFHRWVMEGKGLSNLEQSALRPAAELAANLTTH